MVFQRQLQRYCTTNQRRVRWMKERDYGERERERNMREDRGRNERPMEQKREKTSNKILSMTFPIFAEMEDIFLSNIDGQDSIGKEGKTRSRRSLRDKQCYLINGFHIIVSCSRNCNLYNRYPYDSSTWSSIIQLVDSFPSLSDHTFLSLPACLIRCITRRTA